MTNINKQIADNVYEKLKKSHYDVSHEELDAIQSYLSPLKEELENGNADPEKLTMLVKLFDVIQEYDDCELDMFLGDLPGKLMPKNAGRIWEHYDRNDNEKEFNEFRKMLFAENEGLVLRWRDFGQYDVRPEEEKALISFFSPLSEELINGNSDCAKTLFKPLY